jgi:hypothetical protein
MGAPPRRHPTPIRHASPPHRTINPGNSGGPVFNENSRVIGVVHGALEAEAEISFVIPINHARPLLIRRRGE